MTRPIRAASGLLWLASAAAAQEYVISTFAGGGTPAASSVALEAAIGTPAGIATDAAGDVYFAGRDLNSVFKLRQDGALTRVAGNASSSLVLMTDRTGFFGDGGPATSARLTGPEGVAADDAGNLFIADRGNYRIRKVSRNGIITTVAGTSACCFSGDGEPAISALKFYRKSKVPFRAFGTKPRHLHCKEKVQCELPCWCWV